MKVATHTIWGEVLYHHVSNPFVTGLRKDFMDQLEQAPPRFVIVSKMDDDYVSGSDCSRSFPEFEAFLAAGYFVALDSNDFEIWESNTSSTAELDRIRRAEVGSQKGETAPDRLGAR
ncbi:MAG: hypothetical protein FJY92_11960 [Candidatus Hydrogenedentes bacterium]|nr:hypothetical protein [Candidatus Hydrogenedentota bacterium]